MPSAAPPQGFDPTLIGTLNQLDDEGNQRSAFDTSLLNENNRLLFTLLKQMELVTDEENIDGGKLP
jgi:hypothetical protein